MAVDTAEWHVQRDVPVCVQVLPDVHQINPKRSSHELWPCSHLPSGSTWQPSVDSATPSSDQRDNVRMDGCGSVGECLPVPLSHRVQTSFFAMMDFLSGSDANETRRASGLKLSRMRFAQRHFDSLLRTEGR